MTNIKMNRPILIILVGPTGVGKTELSLRLAEAFDAEIISSDSRQIYQQMPIGTAVATQEEQSRVKHHFVQFLPPGTYYSAAQFEREVIEFLPTAFKSHPVMLMTGGSMLYVSAICEGIDDMPTVTSEIREAVLKDYEENGLAPLLDELQEKDPQYFELVDRKNPKRVMHAIEIIRQTGETFTSFRVKKIKERPFEMIKIGLNRDRATLHERINKRVDQMIVQGLIQEVQNLMPYKAHNSLNTVGYKELFAFFDGEMELDEAIAKIKTNTRNYARRQITWFKKDPTITWFDMDTTSVETILDFVHKKIDTIQQAH